MFKATRKLPHPIVYNPACGIQWTWPPRLWICSQSAFPLCTLCLSTSPTFQKPFSFSLSLPPPFLSPFPSHPSTICRVLCQTLEIQRYIQRIDSLHLTILVTSCAPAVLSSEIQTTIGFCLQPLDLFACVLDCPVFFCSFPVCPVSASSLSDKPEAFLTEHFLPEWFQWCSLTNTRAAPWLDGFLIETNNGKTLPLAHHAAFSLWLEIASSPKYGSSCLFFWKSHSDNFSVMCSLIFWVMLMFFSAALF